MCTAVGGSFDKNTRDAEVTGALTTMREYKAESGTARTGLVSGEQAALKQNSPDERNHWQKQQGKRREREKRDRDF